jgi:hypothetical protein
MAEARSSWVGGVKNPWSNRGVELVFSAELFYILLAQWEQKMIRQTMVEGFGDDE